MKILKVVKFLKIWMFMKIIHLNLALKDGEEPENRERFNSD